MQLYSSATFVDPGIAPDEMVLLYDVARSPVYMDGLIPVEDGVGLGRELNWKVTTGDATRYDLHFRGVILTEHLPVILNLEYPSAEEHY